MTIDSVAILAIMLDCHKKVREKNVNLYTIPYNDCLYKTISKSLQDKIKYKKYKRAPPPNVFKILKPLFNQHFLNQPTKKQWSLPTHTHKSHNFSPKKSGSPKPPLMFTLLKLATIIAHASYNLNR